MMDVRSALTTMPNNQEQEFWQANYWDAVAGRDAPMDGVFLYAVRNHWSLLQTILPFPAAAA